MLAIERRAEHLERKSFMTSRDVALLKEYHAIVREADGYRGLIRAVEI